MTTVPIKLQDGSVDRTALRALVVRSTQRTMAIEGRTPRVAPTPSERAPAADSTMSPEALLAVIGVREV